MIRKNGSGGWQFDLGGLVQIFIMILTGVAVYFGTVGAIRVEIAALSGRVDGCVTTDTAQDKKLDNHDARLRETEQDVAGLKAVRKSP